jgi:hypothetical protein
MIAVGRWPALLPTLWALALLAWAPPAWAHQRAAAVPLDAAELPVTVRIPASPIAAAVTVETPGTVADWLPMVGIALLGLAAAAVALRMTGSRRAVSLTLAGLVALLLFETGLHSVHHLDQPEGAAACAVATVAPHLAAVDADPVAAVHALLPAARTAVNGEPCGPRALVTRWDEGRAPPTSLL